MIELRQHARFPAKALSSFLASEQAGLEHLDGNIALEFFIARTIDDAHTA